MVTPEPSDRRPRVATDRSEPDYRFDFCGGHLAIDFTNTVGSRGGHPEEHLRTFGDVVAWLEAREVVTSGVAARLRREARGHQAEAARAFDRAMAFREALYGVLAAKAAGRSVRPGDLETLNRSVKETFSRARLTEDDGRFALVVDEGAASLEAALHPVVRAAVDLLTGDALPRVRLCGDPECAWLFLDTTRNGQRRWCDMKQCGNRAKVRRFRERQ
jgi:predicted RNA-binding Zn ribbon-like protein